MATDYTALINEQLRRLDGLKSKKTQRDKTIRALAQADVDGDPITAVFGKRGVVGKRTYYHKEKEWYHSTLFQEVLANVTDLVRRRDNEEREALEAEARPALQA